MAQKQHIDTYFRNLIAHNGPELSEHDEAIFMENVLKLQKGKSKRKGLIILFIATVSLLAVLAVVYQFGRFNNNSIRTIPTNAKVLILPEKEVEKIENLKQIETIKPNPINRKNNVGKNSQNDIAHNNNPETNDHKENQELKTIHIPNVDPVKLPYSDFLVSRNPEINLNLELLPDYFAKIPKLVVVFHNQLKPHSPNKFTIDAGTGVALMQGNWTAKENKSAHKELSNFTSGMHTKGSGFSANIGFKYTVGRFRFGLGLMSEQFNYYTTYRNTLNYIPVLDSATGNILAYLHYQGQNGFKVENKTNLFSAIRIPLMVEYEIWKSKKQQVVVSSGYLINLKNSRTQAVFDINSMKNNYNTVKPGKFNYQFGIQYQYRVSNKISVGLKYNLMHTKLEHSLKFGTQLMRSNSQNIAPQIQFNF